MSARDPHALFFVLLDGMDAVPRRAARGDRPRVVTRARVPTRGDPETSRLEWARDGEVDARARGGGDARARWGRR